MPKIIATCPCGNEFQTDTYIQSRGWGKTCSKSCAQQYFPSNKKRPPIPDEAWPSIIERYNNGESPLSIEKSLDPLPSAGSVKKGLQARDIPIRTLHQGVMARQNKLKLATQDVAEAQAKALKAYYAGASFQQIEADTGVSEQMLGRAMKKRGLPARSKLQPGQTIDL